MRLHIFAQMSRTIAHTAMTVILRNEKVKVYISALLLALQGPGKLKGLKIKKEVEYICDSQYEQCTKKWSILLLRASLWLLYWP